MIVLQFKPNGEFTQGVDTSARRKSHKPQGFERQKNFLPDTLQCREAAFAQAALPSGQLPHLYTPGQQFLNNSNGGIYTYLCEDSQGHHYAYENGTEVLADVVINEPVLRMIGHGYWKPLVHQSVEFSPPPPSSRKKLEAMTKSMACNIRQAVYLLEHKYSKDLLSFLTLTLPDLCAEDLVKCCENWDYMIDRLLKWLRKRLLGGSIEFEYVYCTEIQLKRLQSRSEYAPHVHIVFRGRVAKKTPWVISPARVRKAWSGIISCVIGHGNFCSSALENLQRIRQSAARYLSKYLSKGNCRLPDGAKCPLASHLKTQWGGMCRSIRRKIESSTIRITSGHSAAGLAASILRNMDKLVEAGLVRYFKEGYIILSACPVSGVERVLKVGSGCLSAPTLEGGLTKVLGHLENESSFAM